MTRNAQFGGLWIVAGMLLVTGCGGGGSGSSPSFTLSAGPANPSVGQGGSVTTTITVTIQNGFSGSVTLSASGLPVGVTASFNPSSTTSTSVLTLAAAGTAPTGTTAVTVIGTSGSLAPTAPVSLTVAAPSVSVTISPKRAAVVATTQTQQFTPTVTGNMGNPAVTWSVDTVTGGNATVGTISASGLYTPPATGGTHTVTATSVVLATASASASIAVTDLPGVFTYHNDSSRDGANTQEYALTASTVGAATFGKLFSCAVDGAVYTQPLWVPGLSIAGGTHNVVFVATQHDSLYAFDADASPCVMYWQAKLLDTLYGGTPNETPVPCNEAVLCVVGAGYGDIQPEIGVTGTPVIDATTNTIYVVSKSWNPATGVFYQRLHALDLATGMMEKFNGPMNIAASVPGVGDGTAMVSFSPKMEHQRSGLALANGTVYLAWAAHEDAQPYHGWLLGYSASDLSLLPSVFNTTPNGGLGGIWAGGGAPAVDSTGDVYVSTGNGVFDEAPPAPSNDYGDSLVRLHPSTGSTPNGVNLDVAGWFTPYDQQTLANNDTDLGSGAIVLLPDQANIGLPANLLVQTGKEGTVYLVDRDNMGGFNSGSNSQIRQSFAGPLYGLWGTPALWQDNLYTGGQGDSIRQFTFLPTTELFNSITSSQSAQNFAFPGTTPSVSSQGASNGILWAIDASQYGPPAPGPGPAILHAYSATNLATEYWNSTQAAGNRDQAGNPVKFVPPTIANGKVYVSTRTEINVYGLLPN